MGSRGGWHGPAPLEQDLSGINITAGGVSTRMMFLPDDIRNRLEEIDRHAALVPSSQRWPRADVRARRLRARIKRRQTGMATLEQALRATLQSGPAARASCAQSFQCRCRRISGNDGENRVDLAPP